MVYMKTKDIAVQNIRSAVRSALEREDRETLQDFVDRICPVQRGELIERLIDCDDAVLFSLYGQLGIDDDCDWKSDENAWMDGQR